MPRKIWVRPGAGKPIEAREYLCSCCFEFNLGAESAALGEDFVDVWLSEPAGDEAPHLQWRDGEIVCFCVSHGTGERCRVR